MFNLWLFITYYLRSLLKWFLRKTTGLCELQRICYGEPEGAPRVRLVEESLNLTRSQHLKRLVLHLNNVSDNGRFVGANRDELVEGAVAAVMYVKKIRPMAHPQFPRSFGECVLQIWGYRQLLTEVETLRKEQFDSENTSHEGKLLELWDNLMPTQRLEARITKQWQDIGFQGDDPKTDFRGMGLLGLENLLYFSTEYKNAAGHVLAHSQHPTYGYAFAIVGINITCMAWELLKGGDAKTYVYNAGRGPPTLRTFHQFYSYLFWEFDRYWIECKPKNIMEFSSIKEKFEQNIRVSLQDYSTVFRLNLSVDTV